MKIACFMSSTTREAQVHHALLSGFKAHGERVENFDTHETTTVPPGFDLVVFIGVRNKSRKVWNSAKAIGANTLMLDKAYFMRSVHHRFSVNAPQPLYLEQMDYDDTRLKQFRGEYSPIARQNPNRIIYVEATQKYYAFHNLGGVADYAAYVCGKLNDVVRANQPDHPVLQVTWRPKLSERKEEIPKYQNPTRPPNTQMSDPRNESFLQALPTTWCAVVHGSAAGIEAASCGVPVLSLGSRENFPLHDLVNNGFESAINPKLPDPDVLNRRLAQLAWCQFNEVEITSGFAWEHTKRWVGPA